MPETKIEIPAGLVCCTTYGSITPETTQSLMESVRFGMQSGLANMQYVMVPGSLVDKARNESVRTMLGNPNWKYVLFVDADMSFAPESIVNLVLASYMTQPWTDPRGKIWTPTPWADAVGAYCQLRGSPYLCTIDTGTGTWETHDAGLGPLEVIRTGSAFILIKRHVFERMEFPWYGVRPAPRSLDVFAELDNFLRCKMDGQNPLANHPAWITGLQCARQDSASLRVNPQAQVPGGFFSSVGEDSSFCDKMKALGLRIVVNTDIVIQHMERKAITPDDHMKAMREAERMGRLAVGVAA